MKRRTFIKRTLATAVSLPVLGCSEVPGGVAPYAGRVAIIGAGAAGLYAAALLAEKDIEYTIYEASDRVGGRIRPLKGFADFDIELGAEEIHGKNSVWYEWVKNAASFVNTTTTDYYQIGSQFKAENQWASDADFTKALELSKSARTYTGADLNLQAYLDTRLAVRTQHIVQAQVANEYGAAPTKLSVKGVSEEDQLWSAGNDDFLVANKALSTILEDKFKAIIPKVAFNVAIQEIDYSGERIFLTDTKGQKKQADRVIVTVPLAVMQAGDVLFTPPLPTTKTDAISKIGVGAGMKVILQFTKAFWAPNTGSIYGTGLVPEFWVTSAGRSTQSFVLTAFVNGSKAEALAALGANAVKTIVAELDAMYGKGVASGVLKNAYVMDWAKEPFIKGAYSYPVVGGGVAQRLELARPINRRIYFAGEATHYGGHSGTVHGALESAERAVSELVNESK